MSYRCDYCQTVRFDHSDPFASRCIALNGLTIVERGTVAPYVKRMQKRVCVWHKNADQAISPHNSCHLGDTQFWLLVVLDTSQTQHVVERFIGERKLLRIALDEPAAGPRRAATDGF